MGAVWMGRDNPQPANGSDQRQQTKDLCELLEWWREEGAIDELMSQLSINNEMWFD